MQYKLIAWILPVFSAVLCAVRAKWMRERYPVRLEIHVYIFLIMTIAARTPVNDYSIIVY